MFSSSPAINFKNLYNFKRVYFIILNECILLFSTSVFYNFKRVYFIWHIFQLYYKRVHPPCRTVSL